MFIEFAYSDDVFEDIVDVVADDGFATDGDDVEHGLAGGVADLGVVVREAAEHWTNEVVQMLGGALLAERDRDASEAEQRASDLSGGGAVDFDLLAEHPHERGRLVILPIAEVL